MRSTAFGMSRKGDCTIRCKMGNCSLNGETHQKRKELDWKTTNQSEERDHRIQVGETNDIAKEK